VSGDRAVYQFTYTGANSGTLDRPYEGASNAAASYAIFQDVYPLPADCRYLDEDAFSSFQLGALRRLLPADMEAGASATTAGGIRESGGSSNCFGIPRVWSLYMDDGSDPPQMQVKLFPAPNGSFGIPFRYTAEIGAPASTGTTLAPWMQPAALVEGATARIKAHLKDYAGAQLHALAAAAALKTMRSQEAVRQGASEIRLGRYYTRHREGRWRRGDR
jgi:hypothetical protein